MFTRFENKFVNWSVGLGNCEIDDDLYFGIRQQFVDGAGAHAVFLSFFLSAFQIEVGAGDQFEDVVSLAANEIGFADTAAADETDFYLT